MAIKCPRNKKHVHFFIYFVKCTIEDYFLMPNNISGEILLSEVIMNPNATRLSEGEVVLLLNRVSHMRCAIAFS